MFKSFVSLVVVIDADSEADDRLKFIEKASDELSRNFSDYEIILVDNGSRVSFDTDKLSEQARSNTYLVGLARMVSFDLAFLAGLERANGDYTIIFDMQLADHISVVPQMYSQAQSGADIVVLRNKHTGGDRSFSRWLFFRAMSGGGRVTYDPQQRREVLMSRRALNWLLRFRSRNMFLRDLLISSGYKFTSLDVDFNTPTRRRDRSDQNRLAWSLLARRTYFPLHVASLSAILLGLIAFALMGNALLVRLLGFDLTGRAASAEPGWTYLVVLLSMGFLFVNLSLFVVIRMLMIIMDDVQSEPNYIIEQYRRL